MIPNARPLTLATLATFALVAGAGACDTCGGSPPGAADAASAATDEAAVDANGSEAAFDASTACSGSPIDLAAAIGDPTCAITSGIAKSTRAVFEIAEDAGKNDLRQEAVRLDDGRVEVRLVNKGTNPTSVPLSWHPKIPAFIVLADSAKEKVIYELEPPVLAVDLDGGPPTARFARVTIPPGGYAFARVVIDPRIVKRAGRAAKDAPKDGADGAALPVKIGEGKWTLHVGQLVTDVFTGEPASLAWVNEVTD